MRTHKSSDYVGLKMFNFRQRLKFSFCRKIIDPIIAVLNLKRLRIIKQFAMGGVSFIERNLKQSRCVTYCLMNNGIILCKLKQCFNLSTKAATGYHNDFRKSSPSTFSSNCPNHRKADKSFLPFFSFAKAT